MRIVAIGRYMSRITCDVRLSADDLGASGDEFRPGRQRRLMADHEGGGCANARDASAGTAVRVEREARVEHGFCAAHFAHERAGKRVEPGHLDLGAQARRTAARFRWRIWHSRR